MVFFVCEGCNETLKKNQVEKHKFKCRSCYSVTCVDCQQTFHGNDFAKHLICISEAEKYEKNLYKAKKNNKLNPQEAWNLCLEKAVENLSEAPPSIQPFIERLAAHSNVPRIKKKFTNFVMNSLRIHNSKLIEDIWIFFEKFKIPGKEEHEIDDEKKKGADDDLCKENETVAQVPPPVDEEDEEEEEYKRLKKEKKKAKKEMKRKRKEEEEKEKEENRTEEEEIKRLKKEKKKAKKGSI